MTEKLTDAVLANEKSPSTFNSSLPFNSYSTISFLGTDNSNISTPVPETRSWNIPSPPSIAEDTFF